MLTIAALVAAQTSLGLAHGELWVIDEVRHASVLHGLLQDGHWLVLSLDGAPYPDKPPLYFWLLAGIATLSGTERPVVHAVGVALSAIAFALVTYVMARVIAGLDRRGALLAGLLLVSNLFFIERAQAPRMDLMFAAVTNLAATALYGAWSRPAPGAAAVAGLALAGVAVLVKGPLGIVFPVLASVVFLAVRRRLARLARRDVAIGFAAAAGLVGAWLAACYRLEGAEFLRHLVVDQILGRAVASPMQAEGPTHYVKVLPLVALPWTIVWLVTAPAVVRWWRDRRTDGGTSRLTDGTLFLLCLALANFTVLTLVSYKQAFYLVHVLSPLAVLTAALLLALDAPGVRRCAWALVLTFAALGLALPSARLLYPWPGLFHGLVPAALAFGALALVILLLRNRPIPELIAATALGVTIAIQPLVLITRPSLDIVMSPRRMSDTIRPYVDAGYAPVTFQIRPYRHGILSYYVGRPVPDIDDPRELDALLATGRPVVVLTLSARVRRGPETLQRMTLVRRHRLDHDRWVVLVQPPARPGS
jgi:4-amino-4-deoxy-L-arabinose transferase-like glycosyltransferase